MNNHLTFYCILYILFINFPLAYYIELKTRYKEELFDDFIGCIILLFAPVFLFFIKHLKKYRCNCYKKERIKILIECNIYNNELKMLQREMKIKKLKK